MNWLTVFWSINVGSCLTLALMYLAVWCRERESFVRLLFSCIAASAALIAAYELQLIRADTSEEYCAILRWRAVPVWVLVLSLVGFTRLYLRAGRSWLAWSACSLKTLTLIINFVFTPSLYYLEINCPSATLLGRRGGFDCPGHSESLELTQPGNFAAAPCIFR